MKHVFLGIAVLSLVLYVAAQRTLERPQNDGVIRLRWATDDNPARKLQTGTFGEMFPGLEVRVDPGLGSDQTKLIVQCATGTGPDIVDVYSQEQMVALVNAGVLMDLTPYAAEMGFGPRNTYPSLQEGLLIDGKQYRYPCNVWANCLIYNKAIFDDHGVEYPKSGWTWMDFVEVAKQIKERPSKSGEAHIAFANLGGTGIYGELLAGRGGRAYSPDGLRSALDSREALDAAWLYHDLMLKYEAIPTARALANMPAQGGWGSGALTLFSQAKAAMMIIGRWYLIQVPKSPAVQHKLGAVRMPRYDENSPMTGLADTRAAGINAQSPNRMQALAFLQYLASEEYGRLIVHDGDSLPPNPELAKSGEAMANDIEPDPAFHQPFADAIKDAHPWDVSPFIDALEMQRWLGETMDKIENQLVTPDEGMRALTAEVNQRMRRNLEREPGLQRKFQEVTGEPYTPDWWRKYQTGTPLPGGASAPAGLPVGGAA